jgi:nucleoid-associated protein YgaU
MKRLAFFVERSGARGRLLTDSQLAHRIDWRAHDYQARDLAAFFNLAAQSSFPLATEELEFRDILLETGVIRYSANNTFIEGNGVIISISQELPDYLRTQFIVHEGFHALFFLDEDFRAFSYSRYDKLNPRVKRSLLDYFGHLGYDTTYKFLVVNEFMSYTLQQPLSAASQFFKSVILNDENVTAELLLLFQDEALAFSTYVNQRWGFAAGRLHILDRSNALPARYTILSGDTLASIAARPGVYWDARLWWLIYDANRDRISSPDTIRPDTVLTIPSSQGETRGGVWRRDETYSNPFN